MKITFIGHSHIYCIMRASQGLDAEFSNSVRCVELLDAALLKNSSPEIKTRNFQDYDQEKVEQVVSEATQEAQLAVLCPHGNEHNAMSLVNSDRQEASLFKLIETGLQNYRYVLPALGRYVRSPALVLSAPPPMRSKLFLKTQGRSRKK